MPIVNILVDHLADNALSSDGSNAAWALSGLGPSVVPLLEPYLNAEDEQQRRMAGEILQQIESFRHDAWAQGFIMYDWVPENFPPKR